MAEHLPMTGIGPVYVIIIAAVTAAAILLSWFGIIPELHFLITDNAGKILAVIFAAIAAALWFNAAVVMKISKNISENNLVTSGAYAYVRNPIYSAFMLLAWGIILWYGNLYLVILCPLYHLLMTVLLKSTEERWLTELYGADYENYCSWVNRCIPWFAEK